MLNLTALATATQTIERPGGVARLSMLEVPPLFVVEASGQIGPAMMRAILAVAEPYGRNHPAGWDYLVDPRRVTLAHPLNLFWFYKIHRLPHLRRYIALTPTTRILRFLAHVAARLTWPDMLLATPEDLTRLYGRS